MEFWWHLGAYVLVALLAWSLGWFMGYERGDRRWR